MPPDPSISLPRRGLLWANARLFRRLGFAVLPLDLARPPAWGVRPIRGSFPSYEALGEVGARESHFIRAGYVPRHAAIYYNDTGNRDESQLEVYEYAREIALAHGLQSVCDLGCGSGYKLLRYFGDHRTLGVDVAPTVRWLRRRYPSRRWAEVGATDWDDFAPDLVIASDVVEHLVEPDDLLARIVQLHPRFAVISTPDRSLFRFATYNGPPANPAHVREWTMPEFHRYLEEFFEVREHFIACAPQGTQCALCVPRVRRESNR